jgi:phage baseplate assembly protein W
MATNSTDFQNLETIYGIDVSFDVLFGLKGTKDVQANEANTDFQYVSGPQALAQELQRLFDLTPLGSCIDDPDYGIDLDFIGTPLDPGVAAGLTRIACLWALNHPSFASRFRVDSLEVSWDPNVPNALSIDGTLQLYGFEEIPLVRFGPYVLKYLLN